MPEIPPPAGPPSPPSPPPPTSYASCDELGWDVSASDSLDSVCAKIPVVSVIDGGTKKGCSGPQAFGFAEAVCSAEGGKGGARLCSQEELNNREAASDSRCNVAKNALRVWTSTPCGDGSHIAQPIDPGDFYAPGDGVLPVCLEDSADTAYIVCCADAETAPRPPPSPPHSPPSPEPPSPPAPPSAPPITCDERDSKQWKIGRNSPDSVTCASGAPLGECPDESTYVETAALCAAANSRICTADELIASVGHFAGGKCKLTKTYLWSNATCDEELYDDNWSYTYTYGQTTYGVGHHWVYPGKSNDKKYPPLCRGAVEPAGVVCCADV